MWFVGIGLTLVCILVSILMVIPKSNKKNIHDKKEINRFIKIVSDTDDIYTLGLSSVMTPNIYHLLECRCVVALKCLVEENSFKGAYQERLNALLKSTSLYKEIKVNPDCLLIDYSDMPTQFNNTLLFGCAKLSKILTAPFAKEFLSYSSINQELNNLNLLHIKIKVGMNVRKARGLFNSKDYGLSTSVLNAAKQMIVSQNIESEILNNELNVIDGLLVKARINIEQKQNLLAKQSLEKQKDYDMLFNRAEKVRVL